MLMQSACFQRLRFTCLAAMLLASAAQAVVISSGNGTGNSAPPVDDFGFENVGVTDTGLSGVYLGNGWVLTANHVSSRPILLLGVTYQPVPGSGVRLTGPSSPQPDLYVYRINGYPPVPAAVLSSATPTIGETLYCLGNGWTRAATLTTWNALWQAGTPPTVYRGYEVGGPNVRRWGTNAVTAVNDIQIGQPVSSITRAVEMLFDDTGGTAHESQAVLGDSGGGCFAKRSGTWELVGVMFANNLYQNQPPNTAVFWNSNPAIRANSTLAADVAYYRTEIEALTPPPGPVPALSAAAAAALAALLALAARRVRAIRR